MQLYACMIILTFLLQGFAISEASSGSLSSSPDEMSQCIGSVQNGKCICKFSVTHFSIFAVGDSDVLHAAQLASSPPPPQSSPDDIAYLAGGAVGGIAFVVIVTVVIIKMKKRHQSFTEVQLFSIEALEKKSETCGEAVHGGVFGGNSTAQGTPQLTNQRKDAQLEMSLEPITRFDLPHQSDHELF
jgi:hypothetical protein